MKDQTHKIKQLKMPPMHKLKHIFLLRLCQPMMVPNKIIDVVLLLLMVILKPDSKCFYNLFYQIYVYSVNQVKNDLSVLAMKI